MKYGLEGLWAGFVVTTAAYLEAYNLIFWKSIAWPLTLALLAPFLLIWSLKAWLLGSGRLTSQPFLIGTFAGMLIALYLLEPWRDSVRIMCAIDHNCFIDHDGLVDFKRTHTENSGGIALMVLVGQGIYVLMSAVGLAHWGGKTRRRG